MKALHIVWLKIWKLTFLWLIVITGLLMTGCWSSSNNWKNCYKPENPYNAWGHYEWFERAREKWRSCWGNSTSFIEWCEEYYYQLENYENCLNK